MRDFDKVSDEGRFEHDNIPESEVNPLRGAGGLSLNPQTVSEKVTGPETWGDDALNKWAATEPPHEDQQAPAHSSPEEPTISRLMPPAGEVVITEDGGMLFIVPAATYLLGETTTGKASWRIDSKEEAASADHEEQTGPAPLLGAVAAEGEVLGEGKPPLVNTPNLIALRSNDTEDPERLAELTGDPRTDELGFLATAGQQGHIERGDIDIAGNPPEASADALSGQPDPGIGEAAETSETTRGSTGENTRLRILESTGPRSLLHEGTLTTSQIIETLTEGLSPADTDRVRAKLPDAAAVREYLKQMRLPISEAIAMGVITVVDDIPGTPDTTEQA